MFQADSIQDGTGRPARAVKVCPYREEKREKENKVFSPHRLTERADILCSWTDVANSVLESASCHIRGLRNTAVPVHMCHHFLSDIWRGEAFDMD